MSKIEKNFIQNTIPSDESYILLFVQTAVVDEMILIRFMVRRITNRLSVLLISFCKKPIILLKFNNEEFDFKPWRFILSIPR